MKKILRGIVVTLLTSEAKAILKKYKPEVIAITGSVGKTSGKDAVYTALSGEGLVRKSEKSLNSEIGVPLTIIGEQSAWGSAFGWLRILFKGFMLIAGKQPYPRTLIVEVGADHPGDIERTASWLEPDTAIITGIPDIPAHSENFSSPEEVFKEKAMLVQYLKEGGTLILNADDARTRQIGNRRGTKMLTYGIEHGEVRASNVYNFLSDDGKPGGVRFEVRYRGDAAVCEILGCMGTAHVLAALAGFAVGLSKGMRVASVCDVFKNHAVPPGRMRILEGVNGSVIIDDSYNSSPSAALLALETLRALPGSRRIAILGDMRELGVESKGAHELVGRKAAEIVTRLITVGEESKALAQAAQGAGLPPEKIKSYGYGEAAKAGEELLAELRAGDVVLVKGSQNKIRLERCVEKIMAEPSRAKELLVRQESEWKTRY